MSESGKVTEELLDTTVAKHHVALDEVEVSCAADGRGRGVKKRYNVGRRMDGSHVPADLAAAKRQYCSKCVGGCAVMYAGKVGEAGLSELARSQPELFSSLYPEGYTGPEGVRVEIQSSDGAPVSQEK